jgi:hypothetical protein
VGIRCHRHSERVHNYLQRDLLLSLRDAGQCSEHELFVLDVGRVDDFRVDMVSLEEGPWVCGAACTVGGE